jgi:hypothetical protein
LNKIDAAKDILASLGLPAAQRNERSALTLLALADLRRRDPWRSAKQPLLRIWDIVGFTFRKYAGDIAWETEVWIADYPDHMIHFNGPKFLGPYKP